MPNRNSMDDTHTREGGGALIGDVWVHDAVRDWLRSAEQRDLDLRVEEGRLYVSPAELLTRHDLDICRRYRHVIAHLIEHVIRPPVRSPRPADLHPRVATRVGGMIAHGGQDVVPVAVLNVPRRAGACFSCGDDLPSPFGRCAPCRAAYAVLRALPYVERHPGAIVPVPDADTSRMHTSDLLAFVRE